MVDHTVFDVIVVGSGAAGLSAALTAKKLGQSVLVVEKADKIGGTTALSGGWLWIPGNPLAKEAGVTDSLEAARRYIAHEAGNHFDGDRVDAFLAEGGNMVTFFRKNTAVDFTFGAKYPDYHPDHPGGAEEGRSILSAPFEGAKLGKQGLAELALPMPESTFMGMGLNSGPELKHFLNATRSLRSAVFVARKMLSHGVSVLRHGRGTRLVNGNALAARLFRSVMDHKIPYWLSAPLVELIQDQGRVSGVVVQRDGQLIRLIARRGVVLAAGGFPQNAQRTALHYAHKTGPQAHISLAPLANTGDALSLAEGVGAKINRDLAAAAAWAPVSIIRRRDGSVGRFFHLIDRAKPGVIAVNNEGRRFTNESENYHDFVATMIAENAGNSDAGIYLICDHRALRRYGMGAVRPYPLPYKNFIKSGYLLQGKTLDDLAQKMNVPQAQLAATIARLNKDATQNVDAFGKGATSYQRLLGDSDFTPNPCIGQMKEAPFYAVRVLPGDLGTYHGLATDAQTRVLNHENQPIEGLYAVGNDTASIFGGSYPGAGATLGPAMTFGYICGKALARAS